MVQCVGVYFFRTQCIHVYDVARTGKIDFFLLTEFVVTD